MTESFQNIGFFYITPNKEKLFSISFFEVLGALMCSRITIDFSQNTYKHETSIVDLEQSAKEWDYSLERISEEEFFNLYIQFFHESIEKIPLSPMRKFIEITKSLQKIMFP